MNCEVIRDLIPLYDEKLCSDESAALVEEHIKTCAACKGLLEKLPRADIPNSDPKDIKPFVKIKRRLRARIVALIVLGAVLLAVLIPIGYLTVNQIFHFQGGTDFESLIYKREVKAFAEMITEGRTDEYAELFKNVVLGRGADDTTITYRTFVRDRLNAAYENVKRYEPRVGEIRSTYFNHEGQVTRDLMLWLEFTRSDGSVLPIWLGVSSKNGLYVIDTYVTPGEYMSIRFEEDGYDGSFYEKYANADIPDDLRDICAFVNTLYLVGNIDKNDDYDVSVLSMSGQVGEEYAEATRGIIGLRFAHSDQNAVREGIAEFRKTGCSLEVSIGLKRFDEKRNMFYYPAVLIGSDGGREAVVFVKLYFDEYGFRSPRSEDVKGVTGGSDLEMKMSKIFG